MLNSLRHTLRLVLVAALAGFAVIGAPPLAAHAGPAACQRTLVKTVGEPISETSSAINAPEDGLVVSDIDVLVNLRHATPSDLVISLRSASDEVAGLIPTANTLFEGEGENGAEDLRDTLFDDGAPTSITAAEPPFTGRFRPVQPLSVHHGTTGGVYQLLVEDTVRRNIGTLDDWALVLTYQSCDFDADGVEDHRDQCRDLTARTATGCPLTSRAVTAKYRAGKFRGVLTSPVAGCKAGRAVSVFRKRPGPDRRVGTATTRADGSFRLARAKKRGRYYAVSPVVAVPDRAECPAVTSSFRIR